MESKPYDFLFKVIVVGHDNSGKTSLLQRFTDDTFTDSYIATIGVDFRVKTIEISGKTIKAQIWDTAGQERFRTITTSYYRGGHGAMIVYDVTNRSSFNQVENFLTDLEHCSGQSLPKVLIANKCDLHETRCVPTEEGESLAVINNMEYVETSAKLNDNVDKAFEMLLTEIYKNIGKTQDDELHQLAAPFDLLSDNQTMTGKGGAVVSEEESVATLNSEDVPKKSKELIKELQKVTKNMEKLEKTVKTMSKRIEDLEKKTLKNDSRKADCDPSSAKSSVCLIV